MDRLWFNIPKAKRQKIDEGVKLLGPASIPVNGAVQDSRDLALDAALGQEAFQLVARADDRVYLNSPSSARKTIVMT